ncbi:hypothetical protein C5167_050499 [Papaver somniferum]|uniref:Translocon at the inner envelope membrane of chloroplasts 214 n=1 Tax=Papaver somniferum TaxID=3469 RepID=A0A4Y7KQA8_PAPSO|nr:hypothetical protein C5167_050499 [Papaver somniferum]
MEGQRPLVSPPVKNWGLTITSQYNKYAFISCLYSFMVRYSGVLGVEEPHQSIPNLVVKLYCGDDTVGEPLGRIDDCIFDALLVLVHLRMINWLVVNSPRAMEQRIIPDLHRGPSYLFLLRARVMEEGTEKEVSATTGFITGQLMMFISIYYAPLHLALGRPHTITVLVLPYLLFHFFWNNHKNVFDYGSTTRNSMRRMPSPIVTKKLKEETAETEERGESEGETDVEIETISETKGTKQEEGSIEEDPSPSLCSEENSKLEILKLKEDKDLLYHKLL